MEGFHVQPTKLPDPGLEKQAEHSLVSHGREATWVRHKCGVQLTGYWPVALSQLPYLPATCPLSSPHEEMLWIRSAHKCEQSFPGGSDSKESTCLPMQEVRVRSLGQEVPLEKEMATHSSNLAWETPWIEEPGGLQTMESQKSQTRLSD